MSNPWSSEFARRLIQEHDALPYTFVELRSRLRGTEAEDFAAGNAERSEALNDTELDYVSIVASGAAALALVQRLESADRVVAEREVDEAAVIMTQIF